MLIKMLIRSSSLIVLKNWRRTLFRTAEPLHHPPALELTSATAAMAISARCIGLIWPGVINRVGFGIVLQLTSRVLHHLAVVSVLSETDRPQHPLSGYKARSSPHPSALFWLCLRPSERVPARWSSRQNRLQAPAPHGCVFHASRCVLSRSVTMRFDGSKPI